MKKLTITKETDIPKLKLNYETIHRLESLVSVRAGFVHSNVDWVCTVTDEFTCPATCGDVIK